MRPRSLVSLACAALLLSAPTVRAQQAAEPLDIAPLASVDVSRWSSQSFGFSELDVGPAAVRDGNPKTAWQVPGLEGETTTITFDWSGRGPIDPFPVGSIRVDVTPADAPITVAAGPDLATLADTAADVARDASGATIGLRGARLRVLALRLPAGASVAEIRIFGGPTSGTLGAPTATCDDDGVHLALGASGVLGVEAFRSLPGGGTLRLRQRRAADGTLTDATVRFDPRPSTYDYVVAGLGAAGAPAKVTITCEGAARTRPLAGPIHGVIEGFYGRPWTWPERTKIVAAMGALGMDTFIYAPKDDPFHRDHWRDPYDDATVARFRDLAAVGRGVGVNVVWAISPGLDIDPAAPGDVAALAGKVAAMAEGAGIRDAALLMDDIDAAHDAGLGAAHAGLVEALLASMKARDPAARLWFVPTVYAGLAGSFSAGDAAYLAALAAAPKEVPIAWTGASTFAKTIELTDTAAFGATFGRGAEGVWIWDNYPVNDVAIFRRLYARPITGRESLLPASGGLLSNPMRHGLASLPAIASYAELALDPPAYAAARAAGEPLATARLALVLADAEGHPRALEDLFAELVYHDTLWPDDLASPGLTAALAAYASAETSGAPRRAAALDLATRLARLAIADVDLRRDLDDPALADEIDAHARATSVTARTALESLAAARAELAGDATERARRATRAACLWTAANTPSWRTIQDAIQDLVPVADLSACPDEDPFVAPEPLTARRGEPWSHTVKDPIAEAGATFTLVDSAGAAISPEGHITWTPQRLGRFRLVALRSGDAGASAEVLDLVVTEPPEPPVAKAEAPAGGCGCRVTETADSAPAAAALALAVAIARRRRRRAREA